jgi:predicted DCC family thiol-disulfide oxidoreductase YuxK
LKRFYRFSGSIIFAMQSNAGERSPARWIPAVETRTRLDRLTQQAEDDQVGAGVDRRRTEAMNKEPANPGPATAPEGRPLVLFDGGCPMCRREIAHYRRLGGAEQLTWVDITRTPDSEQRFGVAQAAAMARFHVRDAAGDWHTGAYGFVELWSHLQGYRWLGRVIRCLHLAPLLESVYRGFARWRLARRCSQGACAPWTSGEPASPRPPTRE